MLITIQETYEYEVEADSAEEARELFQKSLEYGDGDEAEAATTVVFKQNYLDLYDTEGNEL